MPIVGAPQLAILAARRIDHFSARRLQICRQLKCQLHGLPLPSDSRNFRQESAALASLPLVSIVWLAVDQHLSDLSWFFRWYLTHFSQRRLRFFFSFCVVEM